MSTKIKKHSNKKSSKNKNLSLQKLFSLNILKNNFDKDYYYLKKEFNLKLKSQEINFQQKLQELNDKIKVCEKQLDERQHLLDEIIRLRKVLMFYEDLVADKIELEEFGEKGELIH